MGKPNVTLTGRRKTVSRALTEFWDWILGVRGGVAGAKDMSRGCAMNGGVERLTLGVRGTSMVPLADVRDAGDAEEFFLDGNTAIARSNYR